MLQDDNKVEKLNQLQPGSESSQYQALKAVGQKVSVLSSLGLYAGLDLIELCAYSTSL